MNPKLLVLGLFIASAGWSQTPVSSGLPGVLAREATAVGKRARLPGKERTIYGGEFIDEAGRRSPAEVIHQAPGLLRLEGFRPGRALGFDGERALGVATKADELLMEAFTTDLVDGLFSMVRQGAALRHLGSGFGPDPRVAPNYTGPRFDIYDATGPSIGAQLRSKLYYFDSGSGLLHSTRYTDRTVTRPVQRQTRFSAWRMIDGSAYPGRIDHYEDGRLVFSFTANRIVGTGAVDPASFR